MIDMEGMQFLHITRKSGEWWALIDGKNYNGAGKYRLEIRKSKLGFQVWFDHAPASGYLPSLKEAAQELKLIDAEERLAPSPASQRWGIKELKKAGVWSKD